MHRGKKMKKVETKQVLIRMPAPLLKRIDAAATAQQRSRTAEVCIRLAESFKKPRVDRRVEVRE
jgi:hypothetical protein